MHESIKLTVEGQRVVLFPDTSFAFEWNNILFTSDGDVIPGSYSLPVDVPAEPNGIIFGFPEELANTADLRREWDCELECGGMLINGLLKLRKITTKRYTINIQVGFSAFGELIKSKSIRDFGYGGERMMGTTLKEILNHMQETAAKPDQHDYVFAPVHNPSLREDEYWGKVVNRYILGNFPALNPDDATAAWLDADGQPVYNHFAYNFSFSVIGPPVSNLVYTICPFPRLKYVLEAIVSELGAKLEGNFFDAELSTLYILSNAMLIGTGLNYHTYPQSFRINQVLPNMTFADLLKALRDTFALSVQVGLDKTISILKLKDILQSPEYVDLSRHAAPVHERLFDEIEPFTLQYKVDDDVAGELVKDFAEDDVVLKEPVATVADLSGLTGTEHRDVRLVTSLNKYYRYSLLEEPFGWAFYSDNYLPVKVAGGGDDIEQGIALTMDTMFTVEDSGSPSGTINLKMPSMGVPGYMASVGIYTPQNLRLAFYRGLQPLKEALDGKLYPMLSMDNQNARGQQVGNYSLKLDGTQGTYNTFQKEWLELKAMSRPVIKPLHLDMAKLLQLDFNKKVNIHGNRFIIKKLKFSLPLRKEVTAELVQV